MFIHGGGGARTRRPTSTRRKASSDDNARDDRGGHWASNQPADLGKKIRTSAEAENRYGKASVPPPARNAPADFLTAYRIVAWRNDGSALLPDRHRHPRLFSTMVIFRLLFRRKTSFNFGRFVPPR